MGTVVRLTTPAPESFILTIRTGNSHAAVTMTPEMVEVLFDDLYDVLNGTTPKDAA